MEVLFRGLFLVRASSLHCPAVPTDEDSAAKECCRVCPSAVCSESGGPFLAAWRVCRVGCPEQSLFVPCVHELGRGKIIFRALEEVVETKYVESGYLINTLYTIHLDLSAISYALNSTIFFLFSVPFSPRSSILIARPSHAGGAWLRGVCQLSLRARSLSRRSRSHCAGARASPVARPDQCSGWRRRPRSCVEC